jgi:hypothetical protein
MSVRQPGREKDMVRINAGCINYERGISGLEHFVVSPLLKILMILCVSWQPIPVIPQYSASFANSVIADIRRVGSGRLELKS